MLWMKGARKVPRVIKAESFAVPNLGFPVFPTWQCPQWSVTQKIFTRAGNTPTSGRTYDNRRSGLLARGMLPHSLLVGCPSVSRAVVPWIHGPCLRLTDVSGREYRRSWGATEWLYPNRVELLGERWWQSPLQVSHEPGHQARVKQESFIATYTWDRWLMNRFYSCAHPVSERHNRYGSVTKKSPPPKQALPLNHSASLFLTLFNYTNDYFFLKNLNFRVVWD